MIFSIDLLQLKADLVDIYGNIDFYGISIGILAFILVLLFACYILKKFDLTHKLIMNFVLLSAIGHFIGAIAFYWFSIKNGSDSVFYFQHPILNYHGLGYWFAFLIIGYERAYLLGTSFLGAFLISGAIGFIGSIFYLLTYKVLLDKMSGKYKFYHIDPKQLYYPALLLLCWPSYFFWSSGLIKDNFSFLSIGMILFVLSYNRLTITSVLAFCIGSFLGFAVRPYLFIIFCGSAIIYLLLESKLNFFLKLGILISIAAATSILMPLLSSFSSITNLSTLSVTEVTEYAIRQQQYMNVGSSIPIPTHNPRLAILFLPYLMLINLFLPLGIGARNFIAYISSAENAYFLWWVIFFINNRSVWNNIKNKLRITKFLLIYFIFGISALSLMNTNLGLAMREKMMYVPALLICIFLTYAYKRILAIQQYHQRVSVSDQQLILSV